MTTRNKILILCLILVLSILLIFNLQSPRAELDNSESKLFIQNESNVQITGNDTSFKEQNGTIPSKQITSTYEAALYGSLSDLQSTYKKAYEQNRPNSTQSSKDIYLTDPSETSQPNKIETTSAAPSPSPAITTTPTINPSETPLVAAFQLPLPVPVPKNSQNILQYGALTAGVVIATTLCLTTIIVLKQRSQIPTSQNNSKKSKSKQRSKRKRTTRRSNKIPKQAPVTNLRK